MIYIYSRWGNVLLILLIDVVDNLNIKSKEINNYSSSDSESEEENIDEDVMFDDEFTEEISVNELACRKIIKCIMYCTEKIITMIDCYPKISLRCLDDEYDNSDDDNDQFKCVLCRRIFIIALNKEVYGCKGTVGQNDIIRRAVIH